MLANNSELYIKIMISILSYVYPRMNTGFCYYRKSVDIILHANRFNRNITQPSHIDVF